MAEYLKLKNIQTWGAEAFHKISTNIEKDEHGLKFDSGIQDIQYTEHVLLEQLETCAEYVDKAERYEILGKNVCVHVKLLFIRFQIFQANFTG